MIIKSLKQWFEEAKPAPTADDVATQIGCHFEEVAEMLEALHDNETANPVAELADTYKARDPDYVRHVAHLAHAKRVELLDALCDQIVTAVGVAHMLGFNIEKALAEVNASNWSKFEDDKALFDDNGKIVKGKHYFAPDLDRFAK